MLPSHSGSRQMARCTNNHDADLSIDFDRRIRNASCSFQKYTFELHYRPSTPLKLKIRMLTAEDVETILYVCVTWSLRSCRYDAPRRAHHNLLTRCIVWRKRKCTDHPISSLETLVNSGGESIEATLRTTRILFAVFVVRMKYTKLTRCVMFGELVGSAMGMSSARLQCFRHQDRPMGKLCKTVKQGAEFFM